MKRGAMLLAAGAGVGLLLALRGSASAAGPAMTNGPAGSGPQPTPTGPATEPAQDAYGRVLIVELSGGGSDAERAGIVWVGRNRERLYGYPASAVVRSLVPGRSEWGSGCGDGVCGYNNDLATAHTHPRYPAMVDFARRVLTGDVPNPIGTGRYNFCHPNARDFATSRAKGTAVEQARALELRQEAALAPAAEALRLYTEANRVERVDERYRWDPPTGRYLPAWAVAKAHGGAARQAPITIGTTRFS